jgi:integrase/recombinase XerC
MGDRHLRLVQPNQQQGRQNEVFKEMLRGYATMLLAAGRDRGSVGKLLQMLRGFVVWADAWPWEWTAQDVDEWSADMRDRELALSTLRNRQGVVRRFCEYAVNPLYPWFERCREEFGQVPEQVCHEWNTTRISRSTITVPSDARSAATSFVLCSTTSMTGSSRW